MRYMVEELDCEPHLARAVATAMWGAYHGVLEEASETDDHAAARRQGADFTERNIRAWLASAYREEMG